METPWLPVDETRGARPILSGKGDSDVLFDPVAASHAPAKASVPDTERVDDQGELESAVMMNAAPPSAVSIDGEYERELCAPPSVMDFNAFVSGDWSFVPIEGVAASERGSDDAGGDSESDGSSLGTPDDDDEDDEDAESGFVDAFEGDDCDDEPATAEVRRLRGLSLGAISSIRSAAVAASAAKLIRVKEKTQQVAQSKKRALSNFQKNGGLVGWLHGEPGDGSESFGFDEFASTSNDTDRRPRQRATEQLPVSAEDARRPLLLNECLADPKLAAEFVNTVMSDDAVLLKLLYSIEEFEALVDAKPAPVLSVQLDYATTVIDTFLAPPSSPSSRLQTHSSSSSAAAALRQLPECTAEALKQTLERLRLASASTLPKTLFRGVYGVVYEALREGYETFKLTREYALLLEQQQQQQERHAGSDSAHVTTIDAILANEWCCTVFWVHLYRTAHHHRLSFLIEKRFRVDKLHAAFVKASKQNAGERVASARAVSAYQRLVAQLQLVTRKFLKPSAPVAVPVAAKSLSSLKEELCVEIGHLPRACSDDGIDDEAVGALERCMGILGLLSHEVRHEFTRLSFERFASFTASALYRDFVANLLVQPGSGLSDEQVCDARSSRGDITANESADTQALYQTLEHFLLPEAATREFELSNAQQSLCFNFVAGNGDSAVYVDFSLDDLFDCLSLSHVLRLVALVLLEKKVVLVSSSYSVLLSAGEALRTLIYPLTWSHIYVPVLPLALKEYLHCPTPFIFGLHTSYVRASELPRPSDDLVVVNLDRDSLTGGGDLVLPPALSTSLRDTLFGLCRPRLQMRDSVSFGPTSGAASASSFGREPLPTQAIRAAFHDALLGILSALEAFAFRFEFNGKSVAVVDVSNKTRVWAPETSQFHARLLQTQAFSAHLSCSRATAVGAED
ncbi:hypothetical protein PybrP1_003342 [[Pythium] brassicae (nom. inval.)]|nr:hypothetical protein PybrP1_003342 [[Pythium] brassicae (nom. inval.)]